MTQAAQADAEVMYDGLRFPETLVSEEALKSIPSTPFTVQDLLVLGYPRSGTTWLCEAVTLLTSTLPDESLEDFVKTPQYARVDFIELTKPTLYPLDDKHKTHRAWRSHLPVRYFTQHLEAKEAKIIYIIRNPRDVLTSLFRLYQIYPALGCYKGSWNEFFTLVKEKKLVYSDWLEMVVEFWKCRHHQNLKILFYEDFLDKPKSALEELASFLKIELTPARLEKILHLSSFASMKSRTDTMFGDLHVFTEDNFLAKGVVGGWRNYFTDEQVMELDAMYADTIRTEGIPVRY